MPSPAQVRDPAQREVALTIAWRCARIALLALVAACSTAAPQRGPIQRELDGGARTSEGELSGLDDRREFFFAARAGHRLVVRLESAGAIRGVVVSPLGVEEGGPAGTIFDQTISQSGTWRLRIHESPMGEAWKGRFSVTVDLSP